MKDDIHTEVEEQENKEEEIQKKEAYLNLFRIGNCRKLEEENLTLEVVELYVIYKKWRFH